MESIGTFHALRNEFKVVGNESDLKGRQHCWKCKIQIFNQSVMKETYNILFCWFGHQFGHLWRRQWTILEKLNLWKYFEIIVQKAFFKKFTLKLHRILQRSPRFLQYPELRVSPSNQIHGYQFPHFHIRNKFCYL